ncbi:MAG TPA: ABC transporter permease [Candidatus Acidoferrum sp.]|nr:ABC transporter permease [Candidatus Acidoferrum sp.]
MNAYQPVAKTMQSAYLWVAFQTIVIKEVRRFLRIWVQTLVPPVITIALYFVIFGNLVGSRIGSMGGYKYMEFIVPGLIMMSVMNNAFANVVSSFFSQKFQKSIEELLVSPVPNWVILCGFVTGGVARGLCVGVIASLISLVFSGVHMHNIFITAIVVLLTSVVFSLGGFINAVFARNFDDISIVPTFILQPLIYLGGVFYSVDTLPGFARTVSQFNPIFYMINAFRYGVLGISDVNIVEALGLLTLLTVVMFAFSLRLLHTGKGLRN